MGLRQVLFFAVILQLGIGINSPFLSAQEVVPPAAKTGPSERVNRFTPPPKVDSNAPKVRGDGDLTDSALTRGAREGLFNTRLVVTSSVVVTSFLLAEHLRRGWAYDYMMRNMLKKDVAPALASTYVKIRKVVQDISLAERELVQKEAAYSEILDANGHAKAQASPEGKAYSEAQAKYAEANQSLKTVYEEFRTVEAAEMAKLKPVQGEAGKGWGRRGADARAFDFPRYRLGSVEAPSWDALTSQSYEYAEYRIERDGLEKYHRIFDHADLGTVKNPLPEMNAPTGPAEGEKGIRIKDKERGAMVEQAARERLKAFAKGYQPGADGKWVSKSLPGSTKLGRTVGPYLAFLIPILAVNGINMVFNAEQTAQKAKDDLRLAELFKELKGTNKLGLHFARPILGGIERAWIQYFREKKVPYRCPLRLSATSVTSGKNGAGSDEVEDREEGGQPVITGYPALEIVGDYTVRAIKDLESSGRKPYDERSSDKEAIAFSRDMWVKTFSQVIPMNERLMKDFVKNFEFEFGRNEAKATMISELADMALENNLIIWQELRQGTPAETQKKSPFATKSEEKSEEKKDNK